MLLRGEAKTTVVFDVPRGEISLNAPIVSQGDVTKDHAPLYLVPARALQGLLASVDEETARNFGRQVGITLGNRVAEKYASRQSVCDASPSEVTSALAQEFGISGLGMLSVERWGRAVVVVVQTSRGTVEPRRERLSTSEHVNAEARESGPSSPSARVDVMIAAIVEGMLTGATGKSVSATPLSRTGETLRVLVGRDDTLEFARRCLVAGDSWGDVVASLHRPSALSDRRPREDS